MNERVRQKAVELGGSGMARLLLRYSVPATIGSAAFTLYTVVDRIFLGNVVGRDALAGVSLTFPIFMVCVAIGMLIGIGGGSMASIRLGEGNAPEAERLLGNVVALFVLTGFTLGALGLIFLDRLLLAFGASEATLPMASAYMGVLLWFVPFDFLAMGTNNLLRAEGNPRTAMATLVAGALLNIALDALFILVFGWGIRGAALATGLAKMFSATWILLHFTRGGHRVLTLCAANLRIRWATARSILFIGASPFLLQFLTSITAVLVNRSLVHHGGDVAVAAVGIAFSFHMIAMMPLMGLMQGSQPIYGFNHGARLPRRLARALALCLAYGLSASLVNLALAQSFPRFFVGLFTDEDPQLMAAATLGLRCILSAQPFFALHLLGAAYFQATARPHLSIALNTARTLLFFLPALVILPRHFGLTGVWLAFPTGDVCAALVTGTALAFEFRRLHRAAEERRDR